MKTYKNKLTAYYNEPYIYTFCISLPLIELFLNIVQVGKTHTHTYKGNRSSLKKMQIYGQLQIEQIDVSVEIYIETNTGKVNAETLMQKDT